ncbi:hypothetical protein Q3G72_021928 [Acer saccharum]|nr:hypothetical protein Q3G72_021928 [Acer saccharum]
MEQISGEMKFAGDLRSTVQLLHAIERQSRLKVKDDGRLKVDDDGIGRLMMMIQIGPIVREANIASEGNLDQMS